MFDRLTAATTLRSYAIEPVLWRRRDAVHEKFARLLHYLPSSVAANWVHQGEVDPADRSQRCLIQVQGKPVSQTIIEERR
jgi:hypothetical protein